MPKVSEYKSLASRTVQKRVLVPPVWAEEQAEASAVREVRSTNLTHRGAQKDAEEIRRRLAAKVARTTQANQILIHSNQALSAQEMREFDGLAPDFEMTSTMEIETGDAGEVESDEDSDWVDVDDQVFVHDIETFARSRWGDHWKTYKKTWKQRKQRKMVTWDDLMNTLVNTYLLKQYPRPRPVHQCNKSESMDTLSDMPSVPNLETPATDSEYTIEVYDLWTLQRELTFIQDPEATERHNLAANIAALVLCDYYNTPYRRHIREIVSDAFEIYLRIIRIVDRRIKHTLGWDSPDWHMKNACRACGYQLEGEPKLRFSRLVIMDGNNSLKHMRTIDERIAADTRVLDSDYFLLQEYVDKYAHEVKNKKTLGPQILARRSGDVSDDEDVGLAFAKKSRQGDLTDGCREDPEPGADQADPEADIDDIEKALAEKIRESCIVNWKAVAADEKKKMWSVFQECGIFATACRHGFCEQLCDMIRSGELAKYPIAMVAKMIDALEKDLSIGYDIGCEFEKTMGRTSLGALVKERGLRFVVNAFHRYTHCYPCQLRYHPNIVVSMRLEDLETLERTFSTSNHLASITRYASPYWRRLFIEAFFRQWDDDKNLNLGTFILNNVKQAIDIIQDGTTKLEWTKAALDITDADLDTWEKEQIRFFATVGKKDPYDPREIAYVELLQDLPAIEERRLHVVVSFVAWNPQPQDKAQYNKQAAETRKRETKRRSAIEEYQQIINEIAVLDKAIKRAITAYNEAAAALTPPKEPLDWETVAECNFVEQFNMLNAARDNNISQKPWCAIKVQELMKLRHRVARAHEELQRCAVLADLDTANDPLHGAVLEYAQLHEKVNARIMKRIWEVYENYHEHYAWTKELGTWLKTQAPRADASVEPLTPPDQNDVEMQDLPAISITFAGSVQDPNEDEESDDSSDSEEDEDNGGEEVEASVGAFVDYISSVQ
ncbi:hypothetical protein NM688_g7917 [Phlebia brevispora]|uniref:Uncharacterized protein n=1 Tax=Phlebia brevispora TaxID=194682 RepID=A0ACC1RZM7_9APHY|nr:hypothetical protein NM688_g7917 [Phlebia brevispora]